jgi:hypothetical protein
MPGRVPAGDQLGLGHLHIHPDVVQVALVVVFVVRFDDHSAARDFPGKTFKFLGPLTDLGFDGVGVIEIAKNDLQR